MKKFFINSEEKNCHRDHKFSSWRLKEFFIVLIIDSIKGSYVAV
ncbi:hypothetical protein VCHE48_1049 [Vibrio cholerae HE48]|nr:hypothetical protein VCHE48_1049 [Vibrio cholerae HE48]